MFFLIETSLAGGISQCSAVFAFSRFRATPRPWQGNSVERTFRQPRPMALWRCAVLYTSGTRWEFDHGKIIIKQSQYYIHWKLIDIMKGLSEIDFPLLSLFAECGKRMPGWRTWEIMAWQPMNSSNLTHQETSSWLCVESSIFGARFCVPPPVISTKLWMINYRCYPSRSIGKVISIAVQINPRHFKSFEQNQTITSGIRNQTLPFAMATPTPLLVPRSSTGTTVIFGFSSMPMSLRSCESGCWCWRSGSMGSVNGTIKLKKSLKYMTDMLYIIIIII